EPVNTLDPLVHLYAPDGTLVATDDDGAPDGRNARILYIVPAGAAGTYTASVESTTGLGAYTLRVLGSTVAATTPPLTLGAFDPVGSLSGRVSAHAIDGQILQSSDTRRFTFDVAS